MEGESINTADRRKTLHDIYHLKVKTVTHVKWINDIIHFFHSFQNWHGFLNIISPNQLNLHHWHQHWTMVVPIQVNNHSNELFTSTDHWALTYKFELWPRATSLFRIYYNFLGPHESLHTIIIWIEIYRAFELELHTGHLHKYRHALSQDFQPNSNNYSTVTGHFILKKTIGWLADVK